MIQERQKNKKELNEVRNIEIKGRKRHRLREKRIRRKNNKTVRRG